MNCELCGKPDSNMQAIVEGSLVTVCKQCSKFGEVIQIKKQVERPIKKRTIRIQEEFETIKPNYAEIIKQARETTELTQKEVSKLISEKESIYQKIEAGQFKPSLITAKKLERFFKIKLTESYKEPEKEKTIDLDDSEFTIGDMIKFKK